MFQLLTLEVVELALSFFRQTFFTLALRKCGTYASFPLTIPFVGSDGTKKACLRRWRFARYVDQRGASFSCKFFLSLCRTIFFVLKAGGKQTVRSECLGHGPRWRL
jgi:hypothetical protein